MGMYLDSLEGGGYGGGLENRLPLGFSDILDYLVDVYHRVGLDFPIHLGYGSIDYRCRVPLRLLSVLLEGDLEGIRLGLRDRGLLYEGDEIDFDGLSELPGLFGEFFIEKLLHLFKVRIMRGVPFRDVRRRRAYGMVGSPAIFKERPDGGDFFYDYDYIEFRRYLSEGYYSLYYFGLLHGVHLGVELNELEGVVLGYVRRKGLDYRFVRGYYADGSCVCSGYYGFGVLEDVLKSYSYI
jgi:hypothetical protein